MCQSQAQLRGRRSSTCTIEIRINAPIGRQPEASGKIQTAMIIAAALIEGIGFAALFAA